MDYRLRHKVTIITICKVTCKKRISKNTILYLYLKVSKCWHVDTRTNKRWIIEIINKKYKMHLHSFYVDHLLWSLYSILNASEISIVFLSDMAHIITSKLKIINNWPTIRNEAYHMGRMICFIPYGWSVLYNFQFWIKHATWYWDQTSWNPSAISILFVYS